MRTFSIIVALSATGLTVPSIAQTADNATPPPSAATDSTAATAQVTDAEISRFASAAVGLRTIDADTTMAAEAKQRAMAELVQEKGLTPQRFNEIGAATQSDPELQKRVQIAMAQILNSAG